MICTYVRYVHTYIREYGERMDHHHCKREAAKELLRNYLNVALCTQRKRARERERKRERERDIGRD